MNKETLSGSFPHVTLRQLQIFETVVRLGGFTRAAQSLHLSQPTVSMQVKKLSAILGLQLLEQVNRRAYPTEAGQKVYAVTQEILGQLTALGDLAGELKGEIKGELRLAVITTAAYFMPHLLGSFVENHPLVQPRLTITNREKVIERLKSNQDDLLIMGQVPSELAVEAYPFIDNEMVVVAPPDHVLIGKKSVSLERICQEKFLVREVGSGTKLAVDRLFAKHDLAISPYMELGNAEAIKQGVMAGLGISVLSRRNVGLELSSQKIAVLEVEGFPLIRRWYAVHLKGKHLSLVARTFLASLLEDGGFVLSGDR
ncbi:MAG: LysR family transcriptional regulator [Paracoccaceae bacterium]